MSQEKKFVVPTQWGTFELVEEKSKFIGQVWQVQSEEEARACIEATRKKYHDASHNCWCFRIDEMLLRYSDDGEPQGTAGQPMLKVFAEVEQVCCVVTRYYGGKKLGTGGLIRAYTHCAQGAFLAAGKSCYKTWTECAVITPYNHFETVQKVVLDKGGVVVATEYGADVEVTVQVPKEGTEDVLATLRENTADQVLSEIVKDVSQLVPVEEN